MNFTAETTLSELIRARPISIEVLEDLSGSRYMNHIEDRISVFCKEEELSESLLLDRCVHLRKTEPESNWNSQPLYVLIDHLTESHREFRDKQLPAIRSLFGRQTFQPDLDGYLLKLVYQKYCTFEEDLLWHMDEEERFLFPEILRTEACYIHPDLMPDIRVGLARFLAPIQMESPEEKLKHMIAIVLDNIRERITLEPNSSLTSEAYFLVEELKTKLVAHADLESKVLFPRAIRLEKDLLARIARDESRRNP